MRQFRNGRWMTDIYGPWYCDPYPADRPPTAARPRASSSWSPCNPEGMWNDPAGYGLYLLDVFGNRVPIYRDPEISCWQARPLEPRPTPPVLRRRDARLRSSPDAAEATLLVADVYQGLEGVARGTVKYLRVMEQVPRPWSVWHGYQANDASPGQMVAISLYTHLSIKVLHGVVPVHEDGSAYFTVPARPQHLLAGAGRELHGSPADADVRELPAGRAALVHRLPRAPRPRAGEPPPAGPRRPARRSRRPSRAKRLRGRCTTRPTSSRSSTGTACRATGRRRSRRRSGPERRADRRCSAVRMKT